jgi:hypothetical protein
MEIKIGIQSIARELVVETTSSADEVERALMAALKDGGMFSLRDEKGGRILVPVDKLGYLELIGAEQRRVGFG